jgi:aryl-alcohol dehydrogenase-like predicted oxidoreductase
MPSTRIPSIVLAGTLGLAGVGVGAVLAPVAASAASGTTTTVTDRLTTIKNALSGLVGNGTLTQAQADKVASTLDSTLPQGSGRHGGGRGADLDTAATVLGTTADDLRTQLQAGTTLAQIAQAKGISQATLVAELVTAEKAQIAAAVKAGTTTQAQADQRLADLQTRITAQVTSTRPLGGHDRDGSTTSGGSSATPSTPSSSLPS